MDRAERAVLQNKLGNAIDQAVDVEIEEAYDTGNIAVLRSKRGIHTGVVWHKSRFFLWETRGTVVGQRKLRASSEPDKLVGKLESSRDRLLRDARSAGRTA